MQQCTLPAGGARGLLASLNSPVQIGSRRDQSPQLLVSVPPKLSSAVLSQPVVCGVLGCNGCACGCRCIQGQEECRPAMSNSGGLGPRSMSCACLEQYCQVLTCGDDGPHHIYRHPGRRGCRALPGATTAPGSARTPAPFENLLPPCASTPCPGGHSRRQDGAQRIRRKKSSPLQFGCSAARAPRRAAARVEAQNQRCSWENHSGHALPTKMGAASPGS